MSATADVDAVWYERDAGERLRHELKQLRDYQRNRGGPAEPAYRVGRRNGTDAESMVIETQLDFNGGLVDVDIVFPFEYPDAPPVVYGPAGLLNRHQGLGGNFCWAEDSDRAWSPSMVAAQLLDIVQTLLDDSATGADAILHGEADLPEPLTGLVYSRDAVLVTEPFFMEALGANSGRLHLSKGGGAKFLMIADGIAKADVRLVRRVAGGKISRLPAGWWVALDPPPTPRQLSDPGQLMELVAAVSRMPFAPRAREAKRQRVAPQRWLGITFLEEGPRRGEYRRNWLFTLVTPQKQLGPTLSPFVQAQALSDLERRRRIPELDGLADARVLVVGAGSLGAPVAVELARAGVGHVDIADDDTYDVNNSVRHILASRLAGSPKAAATSAVARQLNPFVTVDGHQLRVGADASAARHLKVLIARADLVIDTTGSPAAARILSRYCAAAAKPLVVAGGTAGNHGADILISRPSGACLACLLDAQAHGTIPLPHAAPPAPLVTPVGCSHPAFSGAGFDTTAIAAAVSRYAVQVLAVSNYPVTDDNWAVLNFRGAHPWRSGQLPPTPGCCAP